MSDRIKFEFQLFIASGTINSGRAIANLQALCDTYLPGQHQIELVDVLKESGRALAERVFMTPTLVRREPRPTIKIIGNLSETKVVLQTLGLGE